MRILRILNNNAVTSYNDTGEEIVVMGNGIAFQKRVGDIINPTKIDKVFFLTDKKRDQFEKLINNIQYDYLQAVKKIIDFAEETLSVKLNENIYILLVDHIYFAVERMKKGFEFKNALLWEIKKFYYKEWKISLKALEIIKEELSISLSQNEAGFIALHIVNAETDAETSDGMEFPTIIYDITNIVRYVSGQKLNEEDLSYERFITHIKFLLQRIISGKIYDIDDHFWNIDIKDRYPQAYNCAEKIKVYIEKKLPYKISEEEVVYLTVHIQRILGRNEI